MPLDFKLIRLKKFTNDYLGLNTSDTTLKIGGFGSENRDDELFIGSALSGDLYKSKDVVDCTIERLEKRYGFVPSKK
ncbi:hypothetical protein [Maribacter sp. HTCC2170]|uniref:hypothetical protein n=1 Tax=Maribacter sp. (strain HTCC2170 / KCCM 42371) TaxID=313603 RepID=UPI00006BD550|nr:hypothetical protein [Maribacter sp. HTCC2170]EAR02528.1 hypothetical protein FB2170_04555 [Maribacter sp. HTCC2170]